MFQQCPFVGGKRDCDSHCALWRPLTPIAGEMRGECAIQTIARSVEKHVDQVATYLKEIARDAR